MERGRKIQTVRLCGRGVDVDGVVGPVVGGAGDDGLHGDEAGDGGDACAKGGDGAGDDSFDRGVGGCPCDGAVWWSVEG